MTHLVRFQIQLGAGIFEHLEVCIFLAFLHSQKKSLTLGSEIMCHVALRFIGAKAVALGKKLSVRIVEKRWLKVIPLKLKIDKSIL